MLTKLTPEQEQLMTTVRDEWINTALYSPAPNFKKVKKKAEWLYKFAGLKKPLTIVVDSPLALQHAANLICGSQVASQVYSQVRSQVYSQVDSQVRSQVDSQVDSQVYSQVYSQVASQVRSQVASQVDSQVDSQKIKFFDTAWDCLSWRSAWAAYYDYYQRIGIAQNNNLPKVLAWLKTGVFYAIMLDKACIVSSCPAKIHFDDRKRLHSTTGPAIAWNDGYRLYFVHGVPFTSTDHATFFSAEKKSAKEVLAIRDVDKRTAIIQAYGLAQFLEAMPAYKLLDELTTTSDVDGQPIHYRVIEFQPSPNRTHRVVQVECHTTHQPSILGVERTKQTEKCMGAIASTWGMSIEEYKPEQET